MSPPRTTQSSGQPRHGEGLPAVANTEQVRSVPDEDLDLDDFYTLPPLTEEQIQAIPDEDMIDYEEGEDTASSTPLPASVDPSQPLSASPAMDAALSEISSDAPASRTRRNERRPADRVDRIAILRGRAEAQRQVEATAKAEADRAAVIGQAPGPRREKRDRAPSGSSPTDSGKKAKSDHPASNPDAMDTTGGTPARIRPTSFDDMYKTNRMWCAVMAGKRKIMGNPFAPTKGWDVKVSLDPGKLAQPSIGFNFRFSKDGTDSKGKGDFNTFALGWEPGVKIGGNWMMERLVFEQATKPSKPEFAEFTYPPAIQALCKKPEDADRLICGVFRTNAHKTSPMDVEWAKALPDKDWVAPYENLNRIYNGKNPSFLVTFWFMNPLPNFEHFRDRCLEPLSAAVKDHTPPFHQYLDENDKPVINLDMPTIDVIGNGMYRRYPTVTDRHGKKVETGKKAYFNMPKTTTWDSIKTFHITYGVPIAREMQFNQGIHVRLERDWHAIYIQRLPVYSVEGRDLQAHPRMKDTFQVGVRMTRDPATGVKDASPPDRTTILFDFYNGNSAQDKSHETIEEHICYGRVDNMGGKSFLEKTKTDFCVLMTMPKRFNLRLQTHKEPKYLTDEDLPWAKLTVKVNHAAALRDEAAFAKFCDEKYAPELLDEIRLAFWSDPSRAPNRVTDLTKGPAHSRSNANGRRYREILEEMKATRTVNKTQDKVLKAAASMRSNMVVVQGPPGAGKTRTMRDKIIALTKIGHKVVCVASSNVAVDTDATAVWNGLSAEDRKVFKCLRLETDGAEKAQRLTKLNFAAYTGKEGEADEMPEYAGPEEAQDHPAIRNALDKLCLDFAARQDHIAECLKKYADYNDALQAIQNYDAMKRSNVPNGMTLDYRIWEVTETDREQAETEYKAVRDSLPSDEFQRLLASGQISVAMFDKSRAYKEAIANYVARSGKVSREERKALENVTDAMIEQVFAETHILFSTASNCGGTMLEESKSFVPTAIFCDETGQISIPSLCVPLTTFEKWEGLFLFGDVQQLEPTALSGEYNEFSANARVSPLALLAMKGFKSLLLDMQYRMSPACSAFPRWQFYDNQGLLDSAKVQEDNDVRKAVRKITKAAGVSGDSGEGSEYVVTNITSGCSRVELNGTSLVNFANAESIIKLIDRFFNEGTIKASMVKILTYYQGQRRLLRKKISETQWTQAVKNAIEISTVDAFQGREARVVIVDVVAAKDKLKNPLIRDEDAPEDDEDLGGEDYIQPGFATRHVRSPNRLNVALTRGKDATFVFCQATLLLSHTRRNRGKQYNATANMIGDANERNCMMTDWREDTHPKSVTERVKAGGKKVMDERTIQRVKDFEFIATGKASWNVMKHLPAIPKADPLVKYRVRQGHTTRPIGNPELTAIADAHDAEQAQIDLAKEASKATAEAHAEEQRSLELTIKESLSSSDFPPLPPAKAVDTSEQPSAMEISEQPPAADTEADDDQDDESEGGRGWYSGGEDTGDAGAGEEEEMEDIGQEDELFA